MFTFYIYIYIKYMCNFHKMTRISESTRSGFDYPVIRFVSSIRGAFIYLFSSLLELYSRRKKLQKKRNKRFLSLLSYFQKLSDNLQASPPFFPRLGSRLCFSSLFFFFFFILPSNFEEERKKCSSWKKGVRT